MLFILRYLADGESYRSLEYQFIINWKAISYITVELAQATVEILGKEFLKTLLVAEERDKISKTFMQRWNSPNQVWAVDGTHILDSTTGNMKEQTA